MLFGCRCPSNTHSPTPTPTPTPTHTTLHHPSPKPTSSQTNHGSIDTTQQATSIPPPPAQKGRVGVGHLSRQDLIPHHDDAGAQRDAGLDVGGGGRHGVWAALLVHWWCICGALVMHWWWMRDQVEEGDE